MKRLVASLAVTTIAAIPTPAVGVGDPQSTPGGGGGGWHEAGCKEDSPSSFLAPLSENHPFTFRTSFGVKHTAKIRVTIQTAYVWCIYGRNKIKPKWTESCYTWIDDEDGLAKDYLQFVKVNNYIWSVENGHSVNQDPYKIKNDHTAQNCKRKDIPYDKEHWLFQYDKDGDTNTFRKAHNTIMLGIQPDPDWNTRNYRFKPGYGKDRDLCIKGCS